MKTEHELRTTLEKLDSLNNRLVLLSEKVHASNKPITLNDAKRFECINWFMLTALPLLHWMLETPEADPEALASENKVREFRGVQGMYVGIDEYVSKVGVFIDETYAKVT